MTSLEKENPDPVAAEIGAMTGIEALPKRLHRYSSAKKHALNVAEYMAGLEKYQPTKKNHKIVSSLQSCGDYLLFRHYFTKDEVRLHAASLCRKHLLCQLCAIRRGAKSLAAYLAKFEALKASRPSLKAYLVTLTIKDRESLKEGFQHLKTSLQELFKHKSRGRGSWMDSVAGAVWSYEFKRGKNSGLHHPHLHMIALSEDRQLDSFESQQRLSDEWHQITHDSFIVDVRAISQDDPASGFVEVFKYATKFSEQPIADTVSAFEVLQGKRLLASSGIFRGVEIPDSLLDEPLADLPFIEYFFSFNGCGYSSGSTPELLRSRSLARPHAPSIARGTGVPVAKRNLVPHLRE